MTTAEIAPQPKLMINVPQSGILSKPSSATSNNNHILIVHNTAKFNVHSPLNGIISWIL